MNMMEQRGRKIRGEENGVRDISDTAGHSLSPEGTAQGQVECWQHRSCSEHQSMLPIHHATLGISGGSGRGNGSRRGGGGLQL